MKKKYESIIFLACFFLFFGYISSVMGLANMFNTMMNTAYDLLINTVFYIMAITVLSGAIAGLFAEFGVIELLNKLLAPLMKPLYDLPGVAALGIVTTYLSDNPAVLSLASEPKFVKHFKKYQHASLANLGTSFGMGLVITIFMISLHNDQYENFAMAALIGNLGAFIGSIFSTRLVLRKTKKIYGTEEMAITEEVVEEEKQEDNGGVVARLINSLLTGGKGGVDLGLSIIPGVLIICTVVTMLTNTTGASGVYDGSAYQGVGLLAMLGDKLQFIIMPLFGFSTSEMVSVLITSLGAAGAAIGMIPNMIANLTANDICVCTAMCICWSGFLSTHIAMMDGIKFRNLTGTAIIAHAVGGLMAGISANLIFKLVMFIL